jgi:hypothetical protein
LFQRRLIFYAEDRPILLDEDRDGSQRASPDLLFLFAPEERPGQDDLRTIVEGIEGLTISVDRAHPRIDRPAETTLWMELHRDGMTFDCSGLAPGPAVAMPVVSQWLGVPKSKRLERLRCVGLSLGPHVRAGQASPPILRRLLGLAREMADGLSNCHALCWVAAGTVIERAAYSELVDRWQDGGPFPAQLVTSFKEGLGGGIESRGLSYFTGQELRIEPGAFADEGQGTLLALRLASQLIYQGRLETAEQATAPDGGMLRLEPSPNGRFVRVWAD